VPPISVLIKAASSKCNLNCEYCFYHDVANNRTVADFGFMSLETIEVIIKKVLQFASGYSTFSFQGGEPTLCGIDFFKSIIELQQKHNVNKVSINNCIQTNGVLIDRRWAEFLHDHNFLVGLSLDGPHDYHDKYRVNTGGSGTFKRVMQTSELLNAYQVEYNILFVVTNLTAGHPDKLYNFFKKNSFNFLQFIPCIDPANTERGVHGYSPNPKRYASFLKHFFDQWSVDFMGGREVSIRYFDNLVRIIMGMRPEICSLQGSCQCQFVFEADGSVYPCDFYVTDKWKLGNIYEDELPGLYESEKCKHFINSSLSLAPNCLQCKWKLLCRGGCRRDRVIMPANEPGRNYYCESYYEFLEYAYPRLVEIARYIQRVQSQVKRSPEKNQQQNRNGGQKEWLLRKRNFEV
jgi:uncharacterized protein